MPSLPPSFGSIWPMRPRPYPNAFCLFFGAPYAATATEACRAPELKRACLAIAGSYEILERLATKARDLDFDR